MNFIKQDFLKPLAHQFEIMNTINGGVSMSMVNVSDFDTKSEIFITTPSVNPESFNIYINNNELMVFSVLPQSSSSNLSGTPMFSRTFTLPPYIDQDNIEALQEGKALRIVLPFKNNSKENMRKIDIKNLY